jgi:hypothetical protein
MMFDDNDDESGDDDYNDNGDDNYQENDEFIMINVLIEMKIMLEYFICGTAVALSYPVQRL